MNLINNILIPTDLSKEDLNAMIYGIELAKIAEAKTTILHAYQLPVLNSEMSVVYKEDVEKEIIKEVEEKFDFIKRNFFYSALPAYEFIMKLGLVENVILETIKGKRADLIVLGSSGYNGILELFGSHTSHIIKKTNCPALVIPHNAKFKKISRILLAYDQHDFGDLDILRGLAETFGSILHILTVYTSVVDLEKEKLSRVILNEIFFKVEHSFHRSYQENIEDAIDQHINDYDIDMLVLIPRHHNLWEKIFSGSLTRKKSFHTSIPMLILHESSK